MPTVFHLLTESEPFSEHHGGAVSRWVANVLRCDHSGVVLAPSADGTWSLDRGQVRVVKGFKLYKFLNDHADRLLRWSLRMGVLRAIVGPALRDLGPGDTVWVHNRPEFAAALEPLVHGRGARLVLHLHNSHLIEFPGRVIEAIKADGYVFLSHFLEREALCVFPQLVNTHVTYSGADETIFFPRVTRPHATFPVALYVGRLVPEKGVHVFVQSLRLLFERGAGIEGVVLGGAGFGESAATPYIQQLYREAPPNLKFQPYCSGSELGERFRDADFFCVPSIWQEALGLVVLEAMASGLPVVASCSGGIPELLAGGGGMLVERGSVERLADALELLATDVLRRRRLAHEAHASFRRSFTWGAVRENYRRILESLPLGEAALRVRSLEPVRAEDKCKTLPTSA
jgi:spore coat protein SA